MIFWDCIVAFAAIVLANYLVGALVTSLRLGRFKKFPRHWKRWRREVFCSWLSLAVGVTERTVAMVLFIYAPSALLPFMGGWMALKYAAGWHQIYGDRGREETLIALVGSAWSFSIAIGSSIVHLSEPALVVIEGRPRNSEFVFATSMGKHFQAFAKGKRKLDDLCDINGWPLHDLRRTVVSGMARLGVPPHVADKILTRS
jgi:hypothetical protein